MHDTTVVVASGGLPTVDERTMSRGLDMKCNESVLRFSSGYRGGYRGGLFHGLVARLRLRLRSCAVAFPGDPIRDHVEYIM